ncbi:MAG: quinolinate synthase NadA [Gammaproteobacteria bacterium]|nr:MAG: quinolinate synthase NadA [Gammaproteobacteria bacterium]
MTDPSKKIIDVSDRIPEFYVPPAKPEVLTEEERLFYSNKIKKQLKEQDAVIVAHFYTHPNLQRLADETGGFVADSLEMARLGKEHSAKTLVVLGVKFMGETSKILSPEKRVIMPDLNAECSLDLSCPADAFSDFCDEYSDRTVVVYANTSAAVKARSDWVVTSSIALEIVKHLHDKGEKIVWGPDKHLGAYIEKMTGVDMVKWQGSCIVHEEFKAIQLKQLMEQNPDAKVLVHPESPMAVIELGDVVGSTSQLLKAVKDLGAEKYIVATESGIFYRMQQALEEVELIPAPSTVEEGFKRPAHALCPWMAMNGLKNLSEVLESGANEIFVPDDIREKAFKPIQRMLDFSVNLSK